MKITLNKIIIMSLISTILSSVGCSGGKNKVLNEKEFTNYYLTILKKQLPNIDFIVLDDLTISSKQQPDTRHFLDNAYRTYKLDTKALDETVLNYINASMSLYKDKEEIQKNKIIPQIKPITYLDDIRELSNGEVTDLLYEQYNEELLIIYVQDNEYNLSSINQKEFEKLGIKKDTLLDFAIENLKGILPDIQPYNENGMYYIVAGGTFETSLILLKSIWTKENFNVDGDFVIAIPCRDLLYITGSNNNIGIAKLKEFAERMYEEGDHNITPFLYKWNGNRFEKYELINQNCKK